MEDVVLIEQLRREVPEFARLYEEHQRLAREVDELERAPYPTTEQDLRLKHLKKLKLRSKDAMVQLLEQKKRMVLDG